MIIDMNRKAGMIDLTPYNAAYDPDWIKLPKHETRFDGELYDCEVVFVSSEWRTNQDKTKTEVLTVVLKLNDGTRVNANLRGDSKTEEGEDLMTMKAECLNFGQLAQSLASNAFQGVNFYNFGREATAYPHMIGMKFKVAIYTYKLTSTNAGTKVLYNDVAFFDAVTKQTYAEKADNKPAQAINYTLDSYKKKLAEEQTKLNAYAQSVAPQTGGASNPYAGYGTLQGVTIAGQQMQDDGIPF